VPHPSFVVYPMIVQAAGGVRVMVMLKDFRLDLEAMARAITPMTKIVFVANPNNPTATIVTRTRSSTSWSRCPSARSSCSTRRTSSSRWARTSGHDRVGQQGRKVVVLRTFSKATSLAGLRVGYGIADADAVALMNRIRQPFNVNSLAQAAALAASTTTRTCSSACA
jgi:histidinol-phosphate aminotransferase